MAMTGPGTTDEVCAQAEQLPGAVLEFPFGPEAAVYKVGGKMFALVGVDDPPGYVTLKADPEEAAALRNQFESVREGYYMNKRHWITVHFGGDVPGDEVQELLEQSYQLVRAALPKRVRDQLDEPEP